MAVSTSPPRVSVIIPSFNTRDLLARCLESLVGAPQPTEVIVYDNASSDGSAETVAERFPTVVLVWGSENIGFARANNAAARVATGDVLLLANSDTEVAPGAIAALLGALDARPDVGIVGARLVNPNGGYQQSARTLPCALNLFLEATGLSRLVNRPKLYGFRGDRTRAVPYVSGAAMAVRRSVWDGLGGFDESFFFYGEDADLCARAGRRGWKTLFCHYAEVIHHGGASTAPIRPDAAVEGYRSAFLFIAKHHGGLRLALARLWVALGAAIRWAVAVAVRAPDRRRVYGRVLRLAFRRRPFPTGRFGEGV